MVFVYEKLLGKISNRRDGKEEEKNYIRKGKNPEHIILKWKTTKDGSFSFHLFAKKYYNIFKNV